MIRYDTYRRYKYDTRYVSRYVSYHLLNTNIAETVIKLKSHICFMQIIFIEAGIEHVCNISNRNFQKFPLAFRPLGQAGLTLAIRQFAIGESRSLLAKKNQDPSPIFFLFFFFYFFYFFF